MKKTILIACDFSFWHEQVGADRRMAALVKYLSQQPEFQVVVYFRYELSRKDRSVLNARFPRVRVYTVLDTGEYSLPSIKQWAKAKLIDNLPNFLVQGIVGFKAKKKMPQGSEGPTLASYNSPLHRNAFQRLEKKLNPDAILCVYLRTAYIIEGLTTDAKKIVDTIDIMSLRAEREKASGLPATIRIDKEEEAHELDKFDLVLAIQEEEARKFEEMVAAEKILLANHPCDLRNCYVSREEPKTIGIIAGIAKHNVDAIRFFLSEIWPTVSQQFPNLEFLIVGGVSKAFEGEVLPQGVRTKGFIDDLLEFYRSVDLLVNPAPYGSGLKIKTVEALAHGMPLVATSIGAEGVAAGDGIVIRDGASEFAEAVSQLCHNPTMRGALATAAFEFATKNFSSDVTFGPLKEWLLRE